MVLRVYIYECTFAFVFYYMSEIFRFFVFEEYQTSFYIYWDK